MARVLAANAAFPDSPSSPPTVPALSCFQSSTPPSLEAAKDFRIARGPSRPSKFHAVAFLLDLPTLPIRYKPSTHDGLLVHSPRPPHTLQPAAAHPIGTCLAQPLGSARTALQGWFRNKPKKSVCGNGMTRTPKMAQYESCTYTTSHEASGCTYCPCRSGTSPSLAIPFAAVARQTQPTQRSSGPALPRTARLLSQIVVAGKKQKRWRQKSNKMKRQRTSHRLPFWARAAAGPYGPTLTRTKD